MRPNMRAADAREAVRSFASYVPGAPVTLLVARERQISRAEETKQWSVLRDLART